MPRLPRKVERRHGRPTGTKHVTRPSQASQVPPLLRKTKMDVAKRHASHAKRRWVSPSVMPATQSGTASRATNGDQARHQTQPSVISTTPATQNEGGCRQVPRLPRETTVDVAKCHACHAKWHGVTGDQRGPSATPDPGLPCKTKVDVAKCHACHVKQRWMSQRAMPATQSGAASRATSASPDPAKRHKYHPCHAKRRWMSPSATPATQNGGGCRQVSCLPRKVARRHGRPTGTKRVTRPSQVS